MYQQWTMLRESSMDFSTKTKRRKENWIIQCLCSPINAQDNSRMSNIFILFTVFPSSSSSSIVSHFLQLMPWRSSPLSLRHWSTLDSMSTHIRYSNSWWFPSGQSSSSILHFFIFIWINVSTSTCSALLLGKTTRSDTSWQVVRH